MYIFTIPTISSLCCVPFSVSWKWNMQMRFILYIYITFWLIYCISIYHVHIPTFYVALLKYSTFMRPYSNQAYANLNVLPIHSTIYQDMLLLSKVYIKVLLDTIKIFSRGQYMNDVLNSWSFEVKDWYIVVGYLFNGYYEWQFFAPSIMYRFDIQLYCR